MDDKFIINITVNSLVVIMFGFAIFVDLNSSKHLNYKFNWRCKRAVVWVIMGLNYAVQVGTRYSLTIFNTDEGRKQINVTPLLFGILTSVSLWVYALAMIINGLLIDKYGGRKVFTIGMMVHTLINLSFGLYCHFMWMNSTSLPDSSLPFVAFYYSATNYLQTLGPLVPMKVIANWYRKEERGSIAGLQGISIASGYLVSFGGNGTIYAYFPPEYVFIIPGIVLFVLTILTFIFVYDSPEDYGIPAEDNKILRSEHNNHGNSQSIGLYNPSSDDFATLISSIPKTMWFHGFGMFICGGIREGFFNYIADYVDSRFDQSPGSILQALIAASTTLGAASSAFFVTYINSLTIDNLPSGGFLYFSILTSAMLAFTLGKYPVEVIIFGGIGSFAMFTIAGLRRRLSMDYGAVKKAAFVTGFLGFAQFVGGGVVCLICSNTITVFGFYKTFFGMTFFAFSGFMLYAYLTWEASLKNNYELVSNSSSFIDSPLMTCDSLLNQTNQINA